MVYFLLLFASYIATLYPTISPYRDSGDLISAAWTLGIAHPPGYPLYSLLGKIFLIIVPFGNPAYKMNLMSAIMGALGLTILLKQFRIPLLRLLIFSLGFTLPYWRLSIVSEMYSINAFFLALIVFAVFKIFNSVSAPSEMRRYAGLIFFIIGVASGNHLTIILSLPVVMLVLFFYRKNFNFKTMALFILFFLLGASIFVYLPVRAMGNALVNWGDPSNIERFWRVITRADYGGLKLHPEESVFVWDAGGVLRQIFFYLKLLRLRFGFLPIFFALTCVVCMFIRKGGLKETNPAHKLAGVFAFSGFIVSGPLFALLANLPIEKPSTVGILEPHFVMPDMFFIIMTALGADYILAKNGSYIFLKLKKFSVMLGAILCFFYVIVIFISKSSSYRYNFTAYDYARNVLATSPAGKTIIYDPDDTTAFTLDYYQYVLGHRTDVAKAVYFRTRWGYERMKKYSKDILPPREIFSGRELAYEILSYNLSRGKTILSELPSKFPSGSLVKPEGLLHRLISLEQNSQEGTSYSDGGKEDFFEVYFFRPIEKENIIQTTPYMYLTRDFFNEHIISYYTSALVNNGLYITEQKKNAHKAKEFYLGALSITDDVAPAWNNLGILAFAKSDYKDAILFFEKSYSLEPDNSVAGINLGLSYRRAGDDERAKMCFEGVLKKGFNPTAANEIGLIYYEKGDYNKAREIFEEIIRRSPSFPSAYYNLGLVYLKTGDPPKAQKFFEINQALEKQR